MTTRESIATLIRRKLRGSQVAVNTTADEMYAVTVVTAEFAALTTPDRQALVYAAMDRLDAEVLALVAEINCRTPWEVESK